MTTIPLLDRVTHQADEEVARRVKDAHAAAAQLYATGEAERAARRQSALAAQRVRLGREQQDACAAMRYRTSGAVLEARARFLDRVFADAERRSSRLAASPELTVCVYNLLIDALRYVDQETPRVRCSDETRAMLDGPGVQAVAITVDDAVPTGAIVESAGGRVSIDATIVGQIRRRRTALSIAALATDVETRGK